MTTLWPKKQAKDVASMDRDALLDELEDLGAPWVGDRKYAPMKRLRELVNELRAKPKKGQAHRWVDRDDDPFIRCERCPATKYAGEPDAGPCRGEDSDPEPAKFEPIECSYCGGRGKIKLFMCKCGVPMDEHDEEPDHALVSVGEAETIGCPTCTEPTYTSEGLTYIAVGYDDSVVVLDSECTILLHEIGEAGMDVLSEYPSGYDPGIWKGVLRYWSSRSYEGDYDSGYRLVGEWEEVDAYPEPECAGKRDGRCGGMHRQRGDGDDAPWACDKHAGRVS